MNNANEQPVQGSPFADKPANGGPRSLLAQAARRRWLIAAGVGCAVCTASGVLDLWLPAPLTPVLALAAGLTAVMIFQPWREMLALGSDDDEALAALTRRTQMIVEGDRSEPLDALLSGDHRLADLSRAVHELAQEVTASRRHARMLHRRLGDNVKRETERATAHLRKQVLTDPLTGLGNRRALEQRVQALARDHGRGLGVAVMLVDLDLFKVVNDTLGHPVGDACLQFLGRTLASCTRRDDCVVRLGGDEFLVLMPGQSLSQARPAADRIVSLFNQMPWPHATVARPGLSIGIAQGTVAELAASDALLLRTDAALYASKRAGRGIITCAELRSEAA